MQFLSLHNPVAFRKVFGNEKHQDIIIHFLNDINKQPRRKQRGIQNIVSS
jgi:hypothetical protein